MKNKLFLLTFIFCAVLYKSQSDFKLATELNDGTQFYIKELGNYEAWVETILKEKKVKSKKTGKTIVSGGEKFVEFYICDCKDKKFSAESRTKYDRKGNPILSMSDIYSERVLPNTVGETILNIICGYEDYLEDIRQKEFDNLPINKQLNEGIDRYNNFIEGFKAGYKSVYCAPNNDCFIDRKYTPDEFTFADEPDNDFGKGFEEGKTKGDNDKNKK
jgi:hypothetical protein